MTTASRIVYLNGEFVPESEAKLSIYDLSVMQAAAAFEMTRSFNGKHFKLREHIIRLWQSCQYLSIDMPSEFDEKVEGIMRLCETVSSMNDHGPGEEHRLLIVVSPGCATMYRDLDGVIPHPYIYISDFPLRYTVQGFSRYFTEGVHCVTSAIQQVPDACVPSKAKHRSRLHFHLAQQQAPAGTWPLLRFQHPTTHHFFYAEAPGANIVVVQDGQVVTADSCALGGISLQTIRELVPTVSGETMQTSLADMSELWLTGTPFFAMPVVTLDGEPIGNGKIGPVYRAMMEKANALVGLNIADQIIGWDEEANARSSPHAGIHKTLSRTT